MALYLLKTEPGEYSYSMLEKAGEVVWDGISAAPALAHLRQVKKGDEALVYHTGDEKAIVGLARFTSDPFEDPASPGVNDAGLPKVPVVKLKAMRAAKTPLTLAQMKSDARFKDWALVKQPRLSVMPVPPALEKAIRQLTGL